MFNDYCKFKKLSHFLTFSRYYKKKRYLPLSTIFPNKFFPLRKFLVEQFHRRSLNWYWHSEMAWLAPFATAANTPRFSRANRLCFLRRVWWTDGSMDSIPGDIGNRLFGSPAFAIPLEAKKKKKNCKETSSSLPNPCLCGTPKNWWTDQINDKLLKTKILTQLSNDQTTWFTF